MPRWGLREACGDGTVLSPDQLRDHTTAYVAAVNSRDAGAVAALFTEDAVQADPASAPPNVGRPAIATFFEGGIAASDSWLFTAAAVHTCGASVAVDFRMEVDLGGSTMTIDGVEVFTFDDAGLITAVSAYWDDADVTLA